MGTEHSATTSRVRIVAEHGGVRFFSRVSGVELSFEGDAPYLWEAASELGIPYEDMHTAALLSEFRKAVVRGEAYTYEPHSSHQIRRPSEEEKARAKHRSAKVGEHQYLLSPTEYPDAWVLVGSSGDIRFGPDIRLDRAASNLALPQGADAAAALELWQATVVYEAVAANRESGCCRRRRSMRSTAARWSSSASSSISKSDRARLGEVLGQRSSLSTASTAKWAAKLWRARCRSTRVLGKE